MGSLLAKGLRVGPQAGRPAFHQVHQAHLVAPLLEPKRQLYLLVSPGAKFQVQSFPAYQQAHPELRVDHQLLAK